MHTHLRGSPMSVGNLEELIDENHAIVSSSIRPEYYVGILSFVDKDQLELGCAILMRNKLDGKTRDKLDCWFDDASQPFNMYSHHPSIVKPILCACLYPNVAATEEGMVGVALGSSRTLNATKDRPHWFDGRREVHIYPSSVNNNFERFPVSFPRLPSKGFTKIQMGFLLPSNKMGSARSSQNKIKGAEQV